MARKKWKATPAKARSPYVARFEEAFDAYKKAMEKYKAENPDCAEEDDEDEEDEEEVYGAHLGGA